MGFVGCRWLMGVLKLAEEMSSVGCWERGQERAVRQGLRLQD